MTKKKKEFHVVYIITTLELGGAQKICLTLFEAFSEQAHLLAGFQGLLTHTVTNNPSTILLNTFKRSLGFLSDCKTFLHLIFKLKKLKSEHEHLIVHTHSTKAGLLGRWAAWCVGIKQRVHTVHGFHFHEHQNKLIWLLSLSLEWITSFITSWYICVSTKDIETGVNYLHNFSQKHSLIRAAVDDCYFIPAKKIHKSTHQFIFGTVSCFKPQKNLFDLLQAFKQVHEKIPCTKLEIIGDGIQRKALEAWIKHHKLTQAITLLGWQQDVKKQMDRWHTFVLSSLWEGLPCAAVEARLRHLPVIAYNTGGMRDIIEDGSNGFLIEQKNITALSHKMLLLATDTQQHTNLAQYHDDLHAFKNSSMILQHKKLYQSLV